MATSIDGELYTHGFPVPLFMCKVLSDSLALTAWLEGALPVKVDIMAEFGVVEYEVELTEIESRDQRSRWRGAEDA